jgi:hypothetical protein
MNGPLCLTGARAHQIDDTRRAKIDANHVSDRRSFVDLLNTRNRASSRAARESLAGRSRPESPAASLTIVGPGSDLTDVSTHTNFHDDGRPGTFANGTKSEKIDYILLSPELFGQVTNAGYCRLGVWGGQNGDLFPHFPEITKPVEAASDHAAVFVDVII